MESIAEKEEVVEAPSEEDVEPSNESAKNPLKKNQSRSKLRLHS